MGALTTVVPHEEPGLQQKLGSAAVVDHGTLPDGRKPISTTFPVIRLEDGGIHGPKCGASYISDDNITKKGLGNAWSRLTLDL